MTRVGGIVLGAGGSRRLGRPKQTLPFGDTTLLGHVMRDVEASSLEPLVLVLGGAADETLESLSLSRAHVTRNDAYPTGGASSLLAGLDAIGECDAVMLLLGDMPGVDAALIEELRRDWEEHRPRLALTQYTDAPGHPFVFAREALDDLRALRGDKAVWKLVESDPSLARRVPVHRELPPDVDTWDDYEEAKRRLRLDGGSGFAIVHGMAERPPADEQVTPLRGLGRFPRSRESLVGRVSNPSFPPALRGYDRAKVDAYVADVSRLVAELEARQSSEAVIQRALEDVGEQTSAILKQAHETADELTRRSRSQADARVGEAEREAERIRGEVEAWLGTVRAEVETLFGERRRLIEEMRTLSEELLALADAALERLDADEAEMQGAERTVEMPPDDDEPGPEPEPEPD